LSPNKEINPFASIINEGQHKSYLEELWDKKLDGKTVTFSPTSSISRSNPAPIVPEPPKPKERETPKSTPRDKK
jgi:hypothetical protein